MARSPTYRSATRSSRAKSRTGPRATSSREARVMLFATLMRGTRPAVRSSPTKPIPAAMASAGEPIRLSSPKSSSEPSSAGSSPKSVRARRVLPAPTRPKTVTTSPWRSSRSIGLSRGDLAQTVGDVDDGHLGVLQIADKLEEAFGLPLGERRGGFVEEQHAHFARERFGNLDELPLSHPEPPHG